MKQAMKHENKYENAEIMNMKTKARKMMKRRKLKKNENNDNKVSYLNDQHKYKDFIYSNNCKLQ